MYIIILIELPTLIWRGLWVRIGYKFISHHLRVQNRVESAQHLPGVLLIHKTSLRQYLLQCALYCLLLVWLGLIGVQN